jgi:D-tagatose-1,6-bisphosphate aldolase subunit GatZ/KbaZ
MMLHDRWADVVVMGEINPDVVVSGVPPMSFNQREDTTGPISMTVGSSVAITSCGLARLGTATAIVGVVGDDAFGDFMLSRLRASGVDVSAVRTVSGGRTGSSVILVRREDAGDRHILTDPGLMDDLRAADLSSSALDRVRHLHIGSWFLHRGAFAEFPALLTEARRRGVATSVDPNHDPAGRWDSHLVQALPHVETLFCNEAEAVGVATASGWNGNGSPHQAAQHLLQRLAPGGVVVLKCGPEGAFAHTRSAVLHALAPPARVVDTVGAGDGLAAGFLHMRLRGTGIDEALRFGVAVGTLSTRLSGGVDGQPSAAEAEVLARQLTCTTEPAAVVRSLRPRKQENTNVKATSEASIGSQSLSPLRDLVRRHRAGERVGITSVCSAHPLVLQAAVEHAQETGGTVLIEATSNQVDQDGGYTGLTPSDFRDLVHGLADAVSLPRERVILGGDHLGPNRWRALPADEAMVHAGELVRAYVSAGFTKIHLDCSFSCADDPVPLTDEIVARRSARLIAEAEQIAGIDGSRRLDYVIGTEVPTPGGAHETLDVLTPTSAHAARQTLQAHRRAFAEAGISGAWSRVAALVVQPGVEFDHQQVIDYRPERTRELSKVLYDEPSMVFEAHSTDYQTKAALSQLVRDHWAILKVGPQLTFALREALFGLAAIESELIAEQQLSRLEEVLESRMLAEPGQWVGYYEGTEVERRVHRRYSYSDRLRYYWPDPVVNRAQERLLKNLSAQTIPLPLISQYLPAQYQRARDGLVKVEPESLVIDHVKDVLRTYAAACSMATQEMSA